MSKVYTSVTELIGRTPLIELVNIEKKYDLKAKVVAKLELFNPAGSVKDRVARAMVEDAEKSGKLKKGSTIIEPTSGNTGIGLASVATAKGYKTILTMPETMSVERRNLLKAYGAEIVLTDGTKGMSGAIAKAKELEKEIDGGIILGQFENPANPKAHFDTTGPEIWEDTDGNVDFFVAGVGTGGTLSGVGNFLKSKKADVKATPEAQLAEAKKQHPLLAMLQTTNGNSLALVGYASVRDTAAINKIIYSAVAKRVLPSDLRLLWSAKPADNLKAKNIFELHALKVTTTTGRAPLEGDVITDAKDEFDQMGSPVVSMKMNTEGARKWAQMTKANVGKAIAIVLDGVVYSAPRVNGEIDGGSSQISGNFTIEDTKDLANTLKSGRMPAPARIVQEEVVGPTLGAQSIQMGIVSFVVAFVLLMVYMVMMYNIIPGMMANLALLVNVFFTLGILTSFQAALTLPGLAGMVLSLGTAVDANVLIYERIKEELRSGKGMKQAVAAGYGNAFSAIFDSNLTSLITGVILLTTGTGPIRGFATTWIIGIVVSFFTAVFLTRLVYDYKLNHDKWMHCKFDTPISHNLMQGKKYKFMSMYKTTFTVAIVAAVVFIGSFFVRGLSKSIDFTGGRNYVVQFENPVEPEQIRTVLGDAFVNADGTKATTSAIAIGTDGKTIRVSTNYMIESNSPTVDDEAETILYNALKKANLVSQASVEAFKNPDVRQGGSIISSTKVGPSVAKDITMGAIYSVLFALIAIFLYILLRFRNVAFSLGSTIALAFDALTVVGFYSLLWGLVPFSLEIDQTFIGAILTVVGYSINDKVVVFDRIRENLKLHPKGDRQQLFNASINETLARTINTSTSTLLVLLCIFILGGDSIRSFSFAMILGVVFGTLSSIFIASPMAYIVLGRKIKEEPAEEVAEVK